MRTEFPPLLRWFRRRPQWVRCPPQEQPRGPKAKVAGRYDRGYPYSEDSNQGQHYMNTRCPAWCDRVLMSPSAKELVLRSESEEKVVTYDHIGPHVCMGDHKPVFLAFRIAPGAGKPHAHAHKCCVVQEEVAAAREGPPGGPPAAGATDGGAGRAARSQQLPRRLPARRPLDGRPHTSLRTRTVPESLTYLTVLSVH
ncbi:hypothetical protein MC885_015539, partial [Smutsia gigantea]